MYSRARVAHHPIHPLAVPLPITSLLLAPITLLVYVVSADGFWLQAAYWLTAFGVITGLLAGIPGLVDYLTIPNRAEPKGPATIHLLLNVVALALGVVGWLLLGGFEGTGTASNAPMALVLLFLVLVVLGVSGWLGGELVYRHGVAVEPMKPAGRPGEDVRGQRAA